MTVIFMILLQFSGEWPSELRERRSRALRQAHEGGLHGALVTRRLMHVAYLGMRCERAPASAHRDERTVAAPFLVGREPVEAVRSGSAPLLFTAIDVPG